MTGIAVTLGLGVCLAFAESGLGLGMLVPGETAVIVLVASLDRPTDIVLLGVAVTVGAALGDHVGYLIGRRYGDALRETPAVRRLGRRHLDRATDLLQRRGGTAVFLTRLVPVVRTLTPAAAGASALEYRRFVVASLTGSALWSATYVGGGTVVAGLISAADDAFGRAAWLLLVLVGVGVLPAALVCAATGVRPGRAAPDTVSLELATGVMARDMAGQDAVRVIR